MNSCNNPNQPFNVRIVIPENQEEEKEYEDIEVRGISPIKVTKRMEGRTKVFIISYSPSIPPTCSVEAIPNRVEIGVTSQIQFIYRDKEGSSKILTRLKTPNDLDAEGKLTITPMTNGEHAKHYYSVTDEEGQVCDSSTSVQGVYRFYKGDILKGDYQLNESLIKSLDSNLGASINEAFPTQEYVITKEVGHFLWVYPADLGSIPTPVGDGNFPFQIVDIPGEWTVNGIKYKASRTSSSFKNGGTATLTF